MSADRVVDAIRSIVQFAYEQGGVVDRIEVSTAIVEGGMDVQFTGYLKPKPLVQNTACVSYLVAESETD